MNVNFITKMEREINLTVDNLQSVGLPTFKLSEKNEGTGDVEGVRDHGQISLNESTQRRFLFPLDIVFVIDNSNSMQNEIDSVKDGLTAFGEELLDRGFDVKYNLITFGPEQTIETIGNWEGKVNKYLDYNYSDDYKRENPYLAIFKDEWFDGFTFGDRTSSPKNDLNELIDAFGSIDAGGGYLHGQENSAWGIHYAIEKLRANGRYLDYSGEIIDDSNGGYMPSQKMIIFLTDENMDTRDSGGKNTLEILGYDHNNVLEKLYAKLNASYNGKADNINLTGLFHVKRIGNSAPSAKNVLTTYDEVPDLGYKYSAGTQQHGKDYYWEEWDDRKAPVVGIKPSDTADVYHTDFKYYNTENNFFMYEMGENGGNVGPALLESINNLGIIQRWELSYLTPFNEYDGTIRTVDFKLIGVKGKDGTQISKGIKDLNGYKEKQYIVQEEKSVIEFKDPTGTCPKLRIVDGRGVITFLAKSRYYEIDSSGENIIIEDLIKDRSLDVLKTDGTLLFSRTTDDIAMSLSEDGWSPFKIIESNLETILDKRVESWVGVENLPIGGNPVKEILSYIDKVKSRIDGINNYEIWLKKSEVERLIGSDLGANPDPNIPYFNLVIGGVETRVSEEYFKGLMGDRSDAWYELKNSSNDPNVFAGISSHDFEKLDGTRYRIRLSDLDLKELLMSTDGEDVELKIGKTKLEAIVGDSTDFEDFGQQGWYEFNVVLTETEMQILRGAKLEYIDLKATAVTDLFTRTKTLEEVAIDVAPPKIVEIRVVDTTLRAFLESILKLDKHKIFTEKEEKDYSGYIATSETEFKNLLNNAGSYVKKGDLIDITLVIEDKHLSKDDIYIDIDELGREKPVITDESTTDINRFMLSWTGIKIGGVSGIISIGNTIEDRYGNTGDQNFGILNIDMTDIEPIPTLKYGTVVIPLYSDGKYYVNCAYDIDLGDIVDLYRVGIVVFNYNASLSDNKDGAPSYNPLIDNDKVYGGGTKESSFEIGLDLNHKTDGEYIGQILGMSKSGKLVDVTNYSDNDLNKILGTNYANSQLTKTKTTIMVDTVTPQITDVVIVESNENDQNYYFDVSFEMEDFNASYKILGENNKGGYSLNIEGNTKIMSESLVEKRIVYEIEVKKGSSPITTITLIAEDKAGNKTFEVIPIERPKDIKVKIYEELYNGPKVKSGEYKFTKGGSGSNTPDPAIYVIIPGDDDNDKKGKKIKELKIERLKTKNPEEIIKGKRLDVLGKTGNIKIDSNFMHFIRDGSNIVRITPISSIGVEGNTTELFKFVVDTRINTSYLEGGIIGDLTEYKEDEKKIKGIVVNLSNLEELSGIIGYSYIFKVGDKVLKSEGKVKGKSYLKPSKDSDLGEVKIDTSRFIGGSRGILSFTVYDKLGNERTYEKTYFIPIKPTGIISKIEGERKQRNSKIKILTDGSDNIFGVESSVDSSLE